MRAMLPEAPVIAMTPGHFPVLLQEVIALLAPRPEGRYLDCTFGGGGHSCPYFGTRPDSRARARARYPGPCHGAALCSG